MIGAENEITELVSSFCLSGLSMGDQPGRQPIGIILSVLGVVVLDFCADASEGPIRAYLLDVADTEEQDMALNIHAASAGIVLTLERVCILQDFTVECAAGSLGVFLHKDC